jgi:hypothetical protein
MAVELVNRQFGDFDGSCQFIYWHGDYLFSFIAIGQLCPNEGVFSPVYMCSFQQACFWVMCVGSSCIAYPWFFMAPWDLIFVILCKRHGSDDAVAWLDFLRGSTCGGLPVFICFVLK